MERLPQMFDHPTARKDEPSPPWNGRSRHLAPVRQSQDLDFPADFTDVSTRELRLLCNRTYEQLDTDHPALETREQYEALVEELERRERQAERRGTDVAARETFRDNALFSRFELFRDGVMAGYMQYEMRGSHVLLLHSVIDPRFRRMGLEPVLMQAVLLNAHRRRLAVVPYCPEAQNFLAAHPQYLSLIPAAQRRRFARLLASRADHAGHNA